MYQALYRKYRPKKFCDVVGQEYIIKILQNTVKTGHIGHAYLFAGPRGTGKTTVAKIFARAVNCTHTNLGEICDECDNCKYSALSECMDIIEIDAASNNGVDEIRDLRTKVNILPSELKYKVYIIDEVHMLSIGAFNALLKTLEEPPHHVIFILATTDPQKIPATIISRCLYFNFKKLTISEIKNRLKEISKKENISIDEDVLEEIAKSSEGGMRDAIGLLDKTSTIQISKITMNDFLELNGQVKETEIENLIQNLFENNPKKVIETITSFYQNGKDLIQIAKQIMTILRNELVNYYLKNINLQYDEQQAIDFINLLNEKMLELKKTDDTKIYLEIMLLHFMKVHEQNSKIISREIISIKEPEQKNIKNEKKILQSKIEKKQENPIEKASVLSKKTELIEKPKYQQWKNLMNIRAKNAMITAKKAELMKEQSNWKIIEEFTFDRNNGYLACELLDGIPRASNESIIIVSYEYESLMDKMASHFTELSDFYQKSTHSTKKIAFLLDDDWNRIKKEYINLIKEGSNFKYEEEPLIEEKIITKNKISEENQSEKKIEEAISLFGNDIIEIN